MRTFTFLDDDDNVLGYWHTDNEKEMSEQCHKLSKELGIKVWYTDGFIDNSRR